MERMTESPIPADLALDYMVRVTHAKAIQSDWIVTGIWQLCLWWIVLSFIGAAMSPPWTDMGAFKVALLAVIVTKAVGYFRNEKKPKE